MQQEHGPGNIKNHKRGKENQTNQKQKGRKKPQVSSTCDISVKAGQVLIFYFFIEKKPEVK